MKEIINTSNVQQGFRTGRSSIDVFLIVKQITQKALQFNKPAYVCFVDLEKAFNNLDLEDVLNV